MAKKDRERSTMRIVYAEEECEEVGALEKPDFDLRRRGFEHVFGVEVTDLYRSESDARLANIHGYATALLGWGSSPSQRRCSDSARR